MAKPLPNERRTWKNFNNFFFRQQRQIDKAWNFWPTHVGIAYAALGHVLDMEMMSYRQVILSGLFPLPWGPQALAFVTNKKIERVPFKHLFQVSHHVQQFSATRVETEEEFVLMVMKHLEEFPVPKIRTLSRFLSGGLAATCGVGSLEEAKMVPVPWLWDVRKVTRSWRQGMAEKWIRLYLRKGDVYCTDELASHAIWLSFFPFMRSPLRDSEIVGILKVFGRDLSNQIPNRCNLDLRFVARQSLQRGLAQRWQGEQWTVKPGCWEYIPWRIHRNWYIYHYLPTWVVDFSW